MPLVDLNGLGYFKGKENAMVAGNYSAASTYAVGDYVYYNGTLYRCTTAIATAEAWTSGHWTAAKVGEDIASLKNAFTELEDHGYSYLNANFVNGSLSNGVINTSITYRVTSDSKFVFDRNITLIPDSGFRFGIHSFGTTGESFVSDSGWKTTKYTIAAGTYFKIVIQEISVTSGVANITRNVQAVKVSTIVRDISDRTTELSSSINELKNLTVSYEEPVNKHDETADVSGLLAYTGKSINSSSTGITTDFIPVTAGDTVYLTEINSSNSYMGINSINFRWLAWYSSADLDSAISCSAYQNSAVAPSGAKYFRGSISVTDNKLNEITINSYPASLEEMQYYFAPYYRNIALPDVERHIVDVWGDSRIAMTNQGDSVTDYLNTLLGSGYNVCNYGISSQSSGQVAMRLGANNVFVSLANNTIPASGSVALSAIKSIPANDRSVYAFSSEAPSPCIINGVRGWLNRSDASTIGNNTFTRESSGSSVSVRAYTKVCVDDMGSNSHVCIFWWGKNDYSQYTGSSPNIQILQNYEAAVKYINHDYFIILGETCSITENYEEGGTSRTFLDALNTELASLYPNNFIDINAWLSSEDALTSVGLTATENDTEFISKGWPCYQLMVYSTNTSDTAHPNAYGRQAIANKIYTWMKTKRWVV